MTPMTDWMSTLDSNALLSTLTLPGSHDTCAYTVDDRLARTQRASLDEQLHNGVRVLDIRCRHERDTFAIHHGGIALGLAFDAVLETCSRFLDHHPGECIVMSVKDEWAPDACSRTFSQTFEWYVARYAGVRWHLGNEIPTVGAARGTIVLLRRFASARPLGIDLTAWPDNATFELDEGPARFSIQDEFRVPVAASIDFKWRAIEAQLDVASAGMRERWRINFCSGTGMAAPPVVVACGDAHVRGIHARLAAKLAASRRPCGTVLLDFCDWQNWELVRALVACNFAAGV
ncbi:phosphatidylinositol-specific phospholipase C [Paraburkholderia sp. Tr-20389]|uniref:phosphatidylinositol-specific phospholipase C n=1 Tax=Paraburkholderia sp. Tr-20389 TaxID=2703903 RepID=UPI001F11A231|nr:phosphatidylinositol-specific phospholipase C [Paraburkholderia sp. Tr-20389]